MKSATISECGKYRYVLRRLLGGPLRWYKPMLFIMLNPSTADAHKDDPTIKRCMNFAKREGATHLIVANLFAYRATKPKDMIIAMNSGIDIVGPENNTYLKNAVAECSGMPIIVGYGNHKFAEKRAREVLGMLESAYCLKKNKNGSPAHPLFISADSPLTIFKEPRPHLEGDLKDKTFVYLAPDGKTFSLWQKHYIWHKWIPKTLGDYAKAYKKMVPEWKNGPCFWGMGDECPDDLGYKFVGFLADQGCD